MLDAVVEHEQVAGLRLQGHRRHAGPGEPPMLLGVVLPGVDQRLLQALGEGVAQLVAAWNDAQGSAVESQEVV